MEIIFVPCAVRNEYLTAAHSGCGGSACRPFVCISLWFWCTVCWLLAAATDITACVIVS